VTKEDFPSYSATSQNRGVLSSAVFAAGNRGRKGRRPERQERVLARGRTEWTERDAEKRGGNGEGSLEVEGGEGEPKRRV
jgi:hypothetical protein